MPLDADLVEDRANHELDHILADLGELHVSGMLRGDDDCGDLDRLVVLVAHGHLRLAIRAQIREGAGLPDLGKLLCETLCKVDRHRHEHVGLVRGVAEHHALVASTDLVDLVLVIGACERAVDALGDIGRLGVDEVHDTAGLSIKAILGARVADLGYRVADDLLHVDVGLGADLAHDDDGAGRREGLDGAADVVDIGSLAVGVDVALLLELCLLREDGIDDCVGNLVAHLVRMALGH